MLCILKIQDLLKIFCKKLIGYNIYMYFVEVSPYGIVGKDFTVLTYTTAKKIPVGSVVEIPVGKKKRLGVVLKYINKPNFVCKEILQVINDRPLPPHILKIHSWISNYYATHPGTVWQTILPTGLNKKRHKSKDDHQSYPTNASKAKLTLTTEQNQALEKILANKTGTSLLHGITGSGKTEVYKSLAEEAAGRGKSSIILIPEISLTAQLYNEFNKSFSNVIVAHSTMTEAERHKAWLKVLTAEEPTIVIGPRSALFMPLANLGLIVIDECHEPSYQQDKAPRYSALRAASKIAEITKSRLVLGSATPSIYDYYMAQKLNRPIVEMNKLARPDATKPETKIIDLTKRDSHSKHPFFSAELLNGIEETLAKGEQVLLFHNRRGTATITLCEDCGWIATCPRCYTPLTLHGDKFLLRCHICGHSEKPSTTCPSCNSSEIIHRGIGTKRIAEEIARLFPKATIKRFDGDNTKSEAVQNIFDEIKSGKIDIIIGTQTIAKGLDLPKLSLVGIVQADAGLALPDFSSSERSFQLIAQASGRVGRNKNASKVIIQTYQPDHPAVHFGASQDYKNFFNHEIKLRQKGHFPPFAHLLKITNSYKTEKGAITSAQKMAREIRSKISSQATILGPSPAFYERQRDNWHWQIILRSPSRQELIKIAADIPLKSWRVELDPQSLL